MFVFTLSLFLFDCLLFALFNQWIVYVGVLYFILSALLAEEVERSAAVYFSLGSLLLRDFIVYGRVGMSVFYAMMIIFLILKFKNVLRNARVILLCLSVMLFFLLEKSVIYPILSIKAPSFLMTNLKIFINVLGGYIVLLGILGRRSRKTLVGRGRKVWTPNRKDALQGL